jgi:hypothetical protein
MTTIRNHFAPAGVIADIDMTNQRFIQALAALVQTPSLNATPRQLFPTNDDSQLPAASPSIRK